MRDGIFVGVCIVGGKDVSSVGAGGIWILYAIVNREGRNGNESLQHRILLPCLPHIAICEEKDASAVGAGGSWRELEIAWHLHTRVEMAPNPLGTESAQVTTNHPGRKTREVRREISGQQTKDQKITHYT
jgi:hypothetical protein